MLYLLTGYLESLHEDVQKTFLFEKVRSIWIRGDQKALERGCLMGITLERELEAIRL
jgi:hypothetical protein